MSYKTLHKYQVVRLKYTEIYLCSIARYQSVLKLQRHFDLTISNGSVFTTELLIRQYEWRGADRQGAISRRLLMSVLHQQQHCVNTI